MLCWQEEGVVITCRVDVGNQLVEDNRNRPSGDYKEVETKMKRIKIDTLTSLHIERVIRIENRYRSGSIHAEEKEKFAEGRG